MNYTSQANPLLQRLRHHVSGAIERGEASAIVEKTAAPQQLTRSHLNPRNAPPAPRGHYSHLAQPHALGQLATLATDPLQPRYVRRFHRAALESSLSTLANAVRSVSTRCN
jgi:hypothetical protein